MKKLSLKMKLGVGFGTLLAIVAAVGYVGYNSANEISKMSDEVVKASDRKELSEAIEIGIEKQSTGIWGFLLAGNEDLLKHDEEGKKEVQESMDQLGKMQVTTEGKKLFAEIQGKSAEFRTFADQEIQLRRAGKGKEAEALAFGPQVSGVRNELRKAMADFVALEDNLKDNAIAAQNKVEDKTRMLALSLSCAGLVIGIVVAILMARSIAGAIACMLQLIQEIAAKNLAVEDMEVTSEDEIGCAAHALNEMKNNLRGMIQSIAQTAEHVASASEEISSSAAQQAQGAETQKDQATQVATAMQEMSSTVAMVSENSNHAAEASRKAAETARHGGTIVEETLSKMRAIAEAVSGTAKKVEELGKSSDQIGRIIGVIDDIADQTNLLALNAAIEAARAGEQGRGFAVVADEVRKLAERTTGATKEIAQMIKNIQEETRVAVTAMESGTKQVEEGVTSTAQAGDSLKEIIRMAEQVGEMITHIATAATQQSSTSEQVNQSMDQIARLVTESADGAHQSAKACQDLSGLALELQKMVSNFQLEETKPYSSARRTAKPAKSLAAAAH